MCGLVGYFTHHVADMDRERLSFLLMLSTTRGRDSTGVASLIRTGHYNQPKDVDFHYLKSPVVAHKFVETPEYRQLIRMDNSKGWMAHTRAATVGVVNAENAHPHISTDGNIIGCHNGTLWGEYPLKKEGSTDSESIMELLSKEGELGLNKIKGAWALTYFNQNNDTFNIIRNAERPLSYVVTNSGDFAYASEAWMLEAMISKFNTGGTVKELPVYQKLTLDLSKDLYIKTLDVAAIEGLEAPKVTGYGNSNFFRQRGWQDAYTYGDWNDDWRKEEPAVQTQLPLVRHNSTPAATGGSLITAAQQAREKAAQKAQQAGEKKTAEVIPLRGTKRGSTSGRDNRLIRNLPEHQRIDSEGGIEVETTPGFWMAVDEFLDLIDKTPCAWSNEMSSLDEKRHWINYTVFVLDHVWESDKELREVLGVNPIDGTPEFPEKLHAYLH